MLRVAQLFFDLILQVEIRTIGQLFAKNSILPEIQEKQSPEAGIRRIHQEISQNLHLKKESLLPRKSLIEINLCKDRISIENQNLLSQLVTIQLKQLNPELSSSIDGTSPASFKLRKIKIYRKKEPKKLTLEQVQINAIQDYPIILQISQSQQTVSNDFTPKLHQACDYNFSSKLIPISQFENQTIQEPNDFLTSHKVKPTHRIKMVDWMIQVLRVLQTPSVQTYFQAIYIMDKYFLEKQNTSTCKIFYKMQGTTDLNTNAFYQEKKIYYRPFSLKLKMGTIFTKNQL
eukprot:403367193